MFDNVILDVAIGLIFIFLIYSILASILLEFISKMLSLRARNLVRGLRRMLQDDPRKIKGTSIKLWDWIVEFGRDFYYYFKPIKEGTLLESFYHAPTIRYLGENSARGLPSSIYPNTFSQTIVHLLRGEGFDSRTQSESVEIWNALQNNTLTAGEDTLRQLRNHFEDSRHDVVQFKILLEKWFDETMERSTGWYTRQSQILLLWIGLGLAASFNVDCIAIIRILQKDKKAREQLVQMAISRQEEYGRIVATIGRPEPADSTGKKQLAQAQAQLDSTRADYNKIKADAEQAQSLMGLGPVPEGQMSWLVLLGWVLTALAISMGATFWFDLLCKLTSFRDMTRQLKGSPRRTQDSHQPTIVG